MDSDNNNLRFQEYWKYIDSCLSSVQEEMGLSNIEDEESLMQCIESRSQILGTVEAFEFFNNHSPYEWSDHFQPEMLKQHNNDLGMIALAITNQIIIGDVFSKLSSTDGYRFLTEGRKTMVIEWKINHKLRKIKLREYWKSRSAIYDYLAPITITEYKGNELTVYQEGEHDGGGDLAFILAHNDPALVWRSKRHPLKQEYTVDEFESKKASFLRKFGFPESELWLTEVQTVKDFNNYFSTEDALAEDYYGISDCLFVLYIHESGSVLSHYGFSTMPEFIEAC